MAEQDDFEAAVNNLMEEANKLPDDITVPNALQQLDEEIQNVVQAAENLKSGLNCVDIAEES
jgi:prefoldin subunit 5